MGDIKNNVINKLVNRFKKEYDTDISLVLDESEQDQSLKEDIEKIFEETNDLYEIQSKLISLLKKYLTIKNQGISTAKDETDADLCNIEKKITEIFRTFIKNLDGEANLAIGKMSRKEKNTRITKQSKKDFKRIIKIFIIHEIYKITNPKRISGETKKKNYLHNLILRGKETASKYEGGSKSDLKGYGYAKIQKMKKQAAMSKNKKFNGFER